MLKTDMEDLTNQFSAFAGTFSDWADSQEKKDNQKDLKIKVAELKGKIAGLEKALLALSITLAGTFLLTALLTAIFPPAAPFILGGGAIAASVEIASMVGITIAIVVYENEKSSDEAEILRLQAEISKINTMRTQLEHQGQADVNTFIINGRVIQGVWTEVVNDASLIKQLLDAGADFASTPKYMKENLEHGVKIYSRMGKYLLDYANGVRNPK